MPALEQQEVPMRKGYDIGIGVIAATGSPMGLGVTGTVSAPQVGSGGSGEFTFRRIDQTSDLETELGISADASGGIGLFSASASFEFTKRCKIQSSSLCVLISAQKKFPFQQIDSPTLSPGAALVASQSGEGPKFNEQFGDYFVRGLNTGGRFVGVVRIDSQSDEAKSTVDSALSLNYGAVMDGDAKLKLSTALKNANAKVEAWYIYDGGLVTIQLNSNDPIQLLNQLYAAMDQWSATVVNAAEAYSVTLAPYEIALGPPLPNEADFQNQRDVLIRCAKIRSTTLDKLNLLDYILDPEHTPEFAVIPAPAGPDLPALQAKLAADLDVVANAASYALEDAHKACQPEDYMLTVKQVANFAFTALPPNMPAHIGRPVVAAANAMPNLVGRPAAAVIDLVSCIQLEGVDHCLSFLGSDLDPLGGEARSLGEFFFYVSRSGASVNVQGDSSPPGAVVTSQFPPPGVLLTAGATFTITV